VQRTWKVHRTGRGDNSLVHANGSPWLTSPIARVSIARFQISAQEVSKCEVSNGTAAR